MKPNLVLIHGWGVNSHVWNDVLPALAETFQVTTIDLPGYGSMVDQPAGDNLSAMADVVLNRAPTSAIWCGWSLGGLVAMTAAMKQPDRVEKLALVCSTPKFMQDKQWTHGSGETAMQNLSDQFEKDYAKALARFFLLQLGTAPDARSRSRELANEVFLEPQASWNTLRSGLNLLRSTDLRDSIKDIQCPTEVIVGTEDRVIPPEAGRFLAREIPNARLHEVEAGHMPFATSRDWFVKRLKQFAGANV